MEKTQDKRKSLAINEVKKIFNIRPESGFDKKPEWLCESCELPLEDQKWLWEYFKDFEETDGEKTPQKQNKNQQDRGRSKVKVKGFKGGMVLRVTYDETLDWISTKKESSKEEISFGLAKHLDDLKSLPYYEKLVAERRCDLLRNCLVITLNAAKRGAITLTKAKYFTGVVKQRTAALERLKRYKERQFKKKL